GQGPLGAVPNLQRRTVIGVFDRYQQADAAAAALREAGHTDEQVSVVRREEGSPPAESADETKAATGTVAGASAGALVGGALGLLALTIPGIGPLVAAGPIAAALSGAVAGGAVGALAGSFAGLGVPTEHAKEYEEAVRSGAVVVAVQAPDEEAASRTTDLLTQHGARSATSYQPAL
ncbi:MAG: DUF3341 domain-containing protein, partial [Chloroflexota bacterium]